MKRSIILALVLTLMAGSIPGPVRAQGDDFRLDADRAEAFARLALDCITREYPNKIGHVMHSDGDVRPPRFLHPAFYGCFDWHSAVHGHWSLVKVLKLFPGFPLEDRIRTAIDQNLTPGNIRRELAYFRAGDRGSFERTYGWAWLLKLCEELHTWQDPQGRRWRLALFPLEQYIVSAYLDFLPRQNYPIRTGVHPNTAFGLRFALDYAREVQHRELIDMIEQKSREYYLADRSCPVSWEPGGEDFFSPCLVEADLMARILNREEFARWFGDFLPGLKDGEKKNLLAPATVLDRSDGKLVHLDGLNLSRAWCLFGIARQFDQGILRQRLIRLGLTNGRSALQNMKAGDYAGGHWLGTFAIYMFTRYQDLR